MRAVIEGDARSQLMQAVAFLDSVTEQTSSGWQHTDPKVLQAQGDASAAIPPMFKMNMVGTMGDLAARLEKPGARFLDVGVGVASLAIGMCRAFPQIHAVGLDVFDVPLAMAKDNVARASLEGRIELRKLAVGDLRDEQTFDLAWLPTFFVPREEMKAALARVHASIKPGGWLLCAIGGSNGDDRQRATLGLMCELWGGATLSAAETESALKAAGFTTVRTLPGPAFAPAMLVAQR
jgi:predicted O-methyltransferase YrrM